MAAPVLNPMQVADEAQEILEKSRTRPDRLMIEKDNSFVRQAPQSFLELLESLAQQINDAPSLPDDTRLVISFGRCRVGSTALTNLVGMLGYPSLFQPFKRTLRWQLQGTPASPEFPEGERLLHCKEMLGPFSLPESLWSIVGAFARTRLRAENVTVIWLERDPVHSWNSWLRHWGGMLARETLLKHFLIASLAAARQAQDIATLGVRVLPFCYEDLKEDPTLALTLLRAAGLSPAGEVDISDLNWGTRGALSSPQSYITFFDEPDAYRQVNPHSEHAKYAYVPGADILVTDHERQTLDFSGVTAIYQQNKQEAAMLRTRHSARIAP